MGMATGDDHKMARDELFRLAIQLVSIAEDIMRVLVEEENKEVAQLLIDLRHTQDKIN